MKTLMGGETEYAISARRPDGEAVPQRELLQGVFDSVKRSMEYTSVSEGGRFLSNGGLLYLDCGLHIEWATPECSSPHDVVRYLAAGDRIVERQLVHFARENPDTRSVFCSRSNVDYLSNTLWGAHESFLHRVPRGILPAQFLPFLASRVVLGAGGWDRTSMALRFTMSPRAHFLTSVCSDDSQFQRPLFHTKDDALSATGSRRLHVACGESLCSEMGNLLRFGTTALVLAAVEHGLRPGDDVALASPLAATRRFARDPHFTTRTRLKEGGGITALELQRHYLRQVESALPELGLPSWADEICVRWRATLDALEAGPAGVDTRLDWAIKHRVFGHYLQKCGLSWEALTALEPAVDRLWRVWLHKGPKGDCFSLGRLVERHPALDRAMCKLERYLQRRGASWDALPALVEARTALLAMDARFSALGGDGIFDRLDRAGALAHRVPGLVMADAVDQPPPDTRARIRGAAVRQLSAAGIRYRAEWAAVADMDRGRVLDLSDPFESREHWLF